MLSLLAPACVQRKAGNVSPSIVNNVQKSQNGSDPLTSDARIQDLETRVRTSPNDVAARLELAGIYENYRACDPALAQYTEVLQVTGTQAPEAAASGLRRCSEETGRGAEAILFLEAFLKTSPSANVWNELGLLQDGAGNYVAGEKALRAALDLSGASERFHNNLGYNLALQNRADDAEKEYRAALKLNAAFAAAHNNLGVLLARRGEVQQAFEHFQQAGDAATAHNNLAVVLLEKGQYEESRAELVKALEIRQYFAPALENLRVVQERLRENALRKD